MQARCQLGNKYGALIEDCAGLLATAQQLNVRVVGVAFHVGSGASNPQAFADAVAAARLVRLYVTTDCLLRCFILLSCCLFLLLMTPLWMNS